jgi:hypothetical protein
MKYDNASWHFGGNFPKDLTEDAGFTHTGLYVAWAVLAGLGSDEYSDDFEDELQGLRDRVSTPSSAFKAMDGKFTDADLSREGNAFTVSYFDFEKVNFFKTTNKFWAAIYLQCTMWPTLGRTTTDLK